jgi:hypothetical protein
VTPWFKQCGSNSVVQSVWFNQCGSISVVQSVWFNKSGALSMAKSSKKPGQEKPLATPRVRNRVNRIGPGSGDHHYRLWFGHGSTTRYRYLAQRRALNRQAASPLFTEKQRRCAPFGPRTKNETSVFNTTRFSGRRGRDHYMLWRGFFGNLFDLRSQAE